VTAKILLKDERSASAGELAGIAELSTSLGLGGSKAAYVTDQIEVLSSRRLMREVVDRHHFNIAYTKKGSFRSSEILEKDMPFIVIPQGEKDTVRLELSVVVNKERKLSVTDLYTGEKYTCDFGKVVGIRGIPIVFKENNQKKQFVDNEFEINLVPKDIAVDGILYNMSIAPSKEMQSYIVNFAMVSVLGEKAKLVLNTLIDVYNTDLTNDKLRMTRATSDFINKRLMLISKDLSGADEQVAEFKSANSMVDMTAEAGVFLNSASDNDRKVLDYRTQLQLVDHMNDYLKNQEKGNCDGN